MADRPGTTYAGPVGTKGRCLRLETAMHLGHAYQCGQFSDGNWHGLLDTRVTAQIIQLAIMAALAVIVGIYAGYRIGCHGRNRVLISGALIFLLAGVDVLFRYYI